MSDIILVGITAGLEKRIRTALGSSNGELKAWRGPKEGEEAAAALADERPMAIILGCEVEDGPAKADPFVGSKADKALDLAGHLEVIDPSITTLLFAEAEAKDLRRAMGVGIREVLTPDAKRAAIKKALDRALDAGRRLREMQANTTPEPTQRCIVVISAKGGAGKTVVSSNLAVALSQGSHRRTVLVDLDLQFGDVATSLLLSPAYSMVDAASAVKKGLDAATLKVFLTSHDPSELYVLCAPEDPALGESLSMSDMGQVLDLLAAEFGYLVVDTNPGLSEMTLMALERATDIVVVVDLDVPSVRGARKLLNSLDVIGMTAPRRHLVLNRANSKVGLTPEEVQSSLGINIDVALPSTRQVPVSMNEGRPIAAYDQRSPFGKQIAELARLFLPAHVRRGSKR